jgi:hypothetical protein
MDTHRELSVHVEHELLLKFETAGLREDLAQMVIESKDNQLAREFVDSLKSRQIPSWEEAKVIIGEGNFFGPEEWKKYFGDKFQITNIPKIPWTRNELKNLNKDLSHYKDLLHFLFLGLDYLDGKPLNLQTWYDIYSVKEHHPKIYSDPHHFSEYLSKDFAKETCKLRWYLMSDRHMYNSMVLSYNSLVTMIPDNYEIASLIERVTADLLCCLLNDYYLDGNGFQPTSTQLDSGSHMGISNMVVTGLFIGGCNDAEFVTANINASRKILDS